MKKQTEQMHPTERSLGGAFRDYVRAVLAGELQRAISDTAEQRWEDEGGSSR